MNKFVSFKEFLNESTNPKQGKKPVNIMVGRFQPFHIGHYMAAKELYDQNSHDVVIVSVVSKGKGKGTSFSQDIYDKMMKKLIKDTPFIIDSIEISYVAFDTQLFANLRPKYEPVLLGAGEDRVDSYINQMNSFRIKKGNSLNMREDFDIFQTKRSTSGTKVREYIKNGDRKNFEKLMPPSLRNFWPELHQQLNETDNSSHDKKMSIIKQHIDVHEAALKSLYESGKKDKKTLDTIAALLIKKTRLMNNFQNKV